MKIVKRYVKTGFKNVLHMLWWFSTFVLKFFEVMGPTLRKA